MNAWLHPSVGLVGRILAIVLLTILIEFCASTVLYDRASNLRVREDEAHRVAEHLASASRVMIQRQPAERPAVAARLSSKNFSVRWLPVMPPAPPMSAALIDMRDQVIAWEPALNDHHLHLYLKAPGRGGTVAGGIMLADGSWLAFKAPQLVDENKFRVAWFAMMGVIAIGVSLIAILLIRWTLRPVRTLSKAAALIGHGQEVEPIPEHGGGEVRGLIRAFNEMQSRIHSLIADRTEALAAVGHDLRTPLSRLQLRSEAISDDALRAAISTDVREMEGMVSSLLAYLGGEDDPEARQRVDVAVMVATLVDEVEDAGGLASYEGLDHAERSVRPVGFKRAMRNIVENAAKYGDRVAVTVQDDDGALVIIVEDDGPGIAPDMLDEVLKPFIRLDPARGRNTGGLGLGLAISARAIELEGASLTLMNREEGGLRVTVRLPREAPASA
ncbi:ATP-binding protein [Sphingobium sp. H39-3-25]|uniref:ATP-binding protein n=1 Tax=Sphingobium arseniciresistens TaxID=3030834 RepID=UPI0023BA09A4|nr:ATP-binding protein [Sphingobium arseniciresistens]